MSFALLHGSEVSEELLTMDYDTYSSELSELEISTLKQYQNIALNLIQLRDDIARLTEEVNSSSTNELQINGMINDDDDDDEDRQGKKGKMLNGLLDELRMLENKMALVSNLFKSSVYQVVVTNASNDDDAIVIGDELI